MFRFSLLLVCFSLLRVYLSLCVLIVKPPIFRSGFVVFVFFVSPFPCIRACFCCVLLSFINFAKMRMPLTVNVQSGRKLNNKSKEVIMKEVIKVFGKGVQAVQIAYEVVRVTLKTEGEFKLAMQQSGVRLFGLWCPILGGPPAPPWFIFLITLFKNRTKSWVIPSKLMAQSKVSGNRRTFLPQRSIQARSYCPLSSLVLLRGILP